MKKLFSIIAILSVFLLNNAAWAKSFTDIDSNHWAYNYVKALSDDDIVVGYPDDSFKPDSQITKAEFAAMAIKALHQENAKIGALEDFADVPKDHWAYDAIEKASYFDLVKGSSDGKFFPDETVSRAQVLSIVINALTLPDMTPADAKKILAKSYCDYQNIPDWILIQAGKAESLGIVTKYPGDKTIFAADKPASRAEVAAFLYNMIEQVKLNPNRKLATVMPKYGEGIILNPTYRDGNIITIPAGTVLAIKLNEFLSTQSTKVCQLFLSKTPDNYVSKDKILLLCKGDKILGQVLEVKKARWFLSNGKLVLETKNIKTHNAQTAEFQALATLEPKFKTRWEKFYRAIIKHAKIEVYDGQCVYVTLLKPLKIDVTNGIIIEDCAK